MSQIVFDLVTKVGGPAAVVGGLLGAWLSIDVDCEPPSLSSGGRTCENVFGEVPTNEFGAPETTSLLWQGAALGAIVGGLGGAAVGAVMKSSGSSP